MAKSHSDDAHCRLSVGRCLWIDRFRSHPVPDIKKGRLKAPNFPLSGEDFPLTRVNRSLGAPSLNSGLFIMAFAVFPPSSSYKGYFTPSLIFWISSQNKFDDKSDRDNQDSWVHLTKTTRQDFSSSIDNKAKTNACGYGKGKGHGNSSY